MANWVSEFLHSVVISWKQEQRKRRRIDPPKGKTTTREIPDRSGDATKCGVQLRVCLEGTFMLSVWTQLNTATRRLGSPALAVET